MEKQEKKFIKFIGKKICEVLESYNYRFRDDFTDYGKECFKDYHSAHHSCRYVYRLLLRSRLLPHYRFHCHC